MTVTSSHIAVFLSILNQNEHVQRFCTIFTFAAGQYPTRVFRGILQGRWVVSTKISFSHVIEREILYQNPFKKHLESFGKCEHWFSAPQILSGSLAPLFSSNHNNCYKTWVYIFILPYFSFMKSNLEEIHIYLEKTQDSHVPLIWTKFHHLLQSYRGPKINFETGAKCSEVDLGTPDHFMNYS